MKISGLLVLVALPVNALAPALAQAGESTPLSLAEAGAQALRDEPGRVVLLERAAAHDELAVAAAQLPDPQVRFGAANLPLESGGFRTEGMSQAQLGVRQVFPPAAGRAANRSLQQAQGSELRAQAEVRQRVVLRAAREAWLDVHRETCSRLLVADSQPLFANLVAVARSLYEVGTRSQQDLLRAELELSHLRARLIALEERERVARASLRRWIGTHALRPLAPLREWPAPPPLAALEDALAEHPALTAAAAALAASDAGIAVARSRFRPNWTLDAAYGYRDGALPSGVPRSDFFSLSATLSVPLFTANRQSPGLRAAQARRRGAAANWEELRRQLGAELVREHDRWLALGSRIRLYEDVVLAQAAANAEASLAAYRSEAGQFADVMRSHINQLEMRLEHIQVRVDRRRSHAALAYLGGFGTPVAGTANSAVAETSAAASCSI